MIPPLDLAQGLQLSTLITKIYNFPVDIEGAYLYL